MKTFSFEVKKEILKCRYESFCCAIAALRAVFQTAGEIVVKKNKLTLALTIDNDDLFNFVFDTIKNYYGEFKIVPEIYSTRRLGSEKKEIIFDEDLGEKLLFDTGLISLSNGNIVINQNIDKNLIMENCCIVAYLSHAFVGCGSISLPTETANGYHMEWSLLNESVASDIAQLLSQLEIFSKTIKRNEKYVVYLKDKSSISELLGKFGAVVSMLKLENTSIEREMRNKINRGANCMTANISKIVDAATKQINSIRCIESTIGIEGLSEALKEMALTRLNYPAASYQELAELLNISKSAVRQRLNSLIEIAENLE